MSKLCWGEQQQNFQLQLAYKLLCKYDVILPCLFSWKWQVADCTLHLPYKHLVCPQFFTFGCTYCGPLQRTSFSNCLSLSQMKQILIFVSEKPLQPGCQFPACFVLGCGEAGMCWKWKFTVVKCWPWTCRISAKPHVQGSCTLAVAIFVLLFFLVSSGLFVTQVPL